MRLLAIPKLNKFKISTVMTLGLLACFWALAMLGDLSFISSKLTATSDLMQTAMEDEASGTTNGENSFAMTARILNFLPYNITWLANIIFGSFAIALLARVATNYKTAFIVTFLVSPAIVLFMVRLLKESILMPILLAITFILASKLRRSYKFCAVVGLYLLYGAFIRNYYMLIAVAFVGLFVFMKGGSRARLLALIFLAALPATLPSELYEILQGGAHRGGDAMAYVRTAFANPFKADDFIGFVGNYIYAMIRLNFPIFFTLSPLEIFHMTSVFCYAYVVCKGVKSVIWEKNIAAYLIIAQVLILWLFEPDLGSYLRHLTVLFPLGAIILKPAHTPKSIKGRDGLNQTPASNNFSS